MKMRKAKIRPFKGVTRIINTGGGDGDEFRDFIMGMGYFVYEDPTDENFLFISDQTLTIGWVKKNANRFGIDLDWWNTDTDFNDRLDEELD